MPMFNFFVNWPHLWEQQRKLAYSHLKSTVITYLASSLAFNSSSVDIFQHFSVSKLGLTGVLASINRLEEKTATTTSPVNDFFVLA